MPLENRISESSINFSKEDFNKQRVVCYFWSIVPFCCEYLRYSLASWLLLKNAGFFRGEELRRKEFHEPGILKSCTVVSLETTLLVIQYYSINPLLFEEESLYIQVQSLPNIQTQSQAFRITSNIIKDNDQKLSTPTWKA